MQITEAYETRKGHTFTQLIVQGFEVACVPCTVTIEVDEINRADNCAYFGVIDFETVSDEDKEAVFESDIDEQEISSIVFNHFGMEA